MARVLEAIQASGWRYECSDPGTHPLRVGAVSEDRRVELLVYIWNITHGGRGRSPSEYRIQITGVDALELDPSSFTTLLLGLYRENDDEILIAFDPVHHQSFGSSPSIQVSIDTINEARENGLAVQEKYRGVEATEIVVAFTPEVLLEYVTGIFPNYHSGTVDSIEQEEIVAITRKPEEMVAPPDLEVLPQARQRAATELNKIKRDSTFRRRVLFAYSGRCAICGLQLRIVSACHIVPAIVGSDETCNGLVLCPNHHRAYDRGIVGIMPDYTVTLNEKRVSELAELGLEGGLTEFLGSTRVGEQIHLPEDSTLRPKPEYLAEGLKLRGFPQRYP